MKEDIAYLRIGGVMQGEEESVLQDGLQDARAKLGEIVKDLRFDDDDDSIYQQEDEELAAERERRRREANKEEMKRFHRLVLDQRTPGLTE